jgi:hypothetical protein
VLVTKLRNLIKNRRVRELPQMRNFRVKGPLLRFFEVDRSSETGCGSQIFKIKKVRPWVSHA